MEQRTMTTTFPERPRVALLVKWLMFTASILFMAIMAMFYPVWANIPLIVIPSLLVLIFAKPVFFEKMKLTTLVLMRIIIVFAAYRLFNPQIYVDVILLMLIINILEATFTDLLRHKKYFNAVSGFALAIGVIALKGAWAYGAPIGNYYLVSGPTLAVTLCYVFAYTLWNWIFVSDEFSASVSLMHVGFLLAPILGSLATLGLGAYGGFGMWLLLRANTLSIGGWMQISAKGWFEKEFYSPKFEKFIAWSHQKGPQIVFMLINIALIATCIGIAASLGAIGFTPAPWQAPNV
jgi:hypothetical protein